MQVWMAAGLLLVSILGIIYFARAKAMIKSMRIVGIVACSLAVLFLIVYLFLVMARRGGIQVQNPV